MFLGVRLNAGLYFSFHLQPSHVCSSKPEISCMVLILLVICQILPDSVMPISRPAVQMSNGNKHNKFFIFIRTVNQSVRKPVHQTATNIRFNFRTGVWIISYTAERHVYLAKEFYPEIRSLLIVPLNGSSSSFCATVRKRIFIYDIFPLLRHRKQFSVFLLYMPSIVILLLLPTIFQPPDPDGPAV